jgi:rRNA maturation endonuclease Nob1
MNEPTDYICPKCKTPYPSTTNKFCVCGGKLQKKFTMRDVEEIFPWLRKAKT